MFYKALFILIASFAFAIGANADDECDSILKNGVHNSYEWIRSQDIRSAYNREFCQKSSQQRNSNQGGGLDVGYKMFELSGDYSESQANSVAQESCDKSSGRLDDAGYQKLLQMTVSSEITQAWTTCRRYISGPIILGNLNGSTLILEYRFRAAGNISSTEILNNPTVIGATCDNAVQKGTLLHSGGISATCNREGKGAITAVVNTAYGTARFFAPAIQDRPPATAAVPLLPKTVSNAAAFRISPDGTFTPYLRQAAGNGTKSICVNKYPLPSPPGSSLPPAYGFCAVSAPSQGNCRCPLHKMPPPPWPQVADFEEWKARLPITGYTEGEIAVFGETN